MVNDDESLFDVKSGKLSFSLSFLLLFTFSSRPSVATKCQKLDSSMGNVVRIKHGSWTHRIRNGSGFLLYCFRSFLSFLFSSPTFLSCLFSFRLSFLFDGLRKRKEACHVTRCLILQFANTKILPFSAKIFLIAYSLLPIELVSA